ncbi:MAG: type II toxin-antitoxin system HicB family antitoxin [Nostocaceae cyanobacterium]|nr:type II toxin-antitoxin system HicB family antitoxin [Nostocaceae cyanobacterium]
MNKFTYPVLIQELEDGYKATVLGLPNCESIAETREAALTNLQQVLTEFLAKADIVSLEIELPKREHPWMKFAGIFKDDPLFNDMLEDIAAYRRERDAEMEEYYRQLDAEDKAVK